MVASQAASDMLDSHRDLRSPHSCFAYGMGHRDAVGREGADDGSLARHEEGDGEAQVGKARSRGRDEEVREGPEGDEDEGLGEEGHGAHEDHEGLGDDGDGDREAYLAAGLDLFLSWVDEGWVKGSLRLPQKIAGSLVMLARDCSWCRRLAVAIVMLGSD